jgi:glycosyltransferase involved in cell wall biosynthesis
MIRKMGKITNCLISSRVGTSFLRGLTNLYDGMFCTTGAVAEQAEHRKKGDCILRFSVAIPHYNRGSSIARPLRNLLNHPAVEEVVIVDDGSHEEQWRLVRQAVEKIPHDGKIRMHRRDKNLGALRTKLECVERSSSQWVLILDSDNTAFQNYLNALASLEDPKKDTIYCASWAFPFFPFHELGEEAITFEKAKEFTRSGLLKRVYIINDGNYLVPRDEYVRNVSEIPDARNHAADVMLVNYRWLSAGNRMQILPATSYFHRIEGSSFWENTKESSKAEALRLFARFEAGQKWSPDF